MSQPPTGPGGYPPPYPSQPPAAPGQPPSGGAVYGSTYGAPRQPTPEQAAPQQYGTQNPQSVPPAGSAGYPQSAPPAGSGHPPAGQVSVPPAGGSAFGQPMSVPPASGPAYGQPMSSPPGSAPPFGAPAPGGPGKSHKVLILAVVAGLLFVLGGVMTGLYLTTSSELDRTEKKMASEVSQRDGTIAANGKEIEKLKTDLQTVKDKLDDTEQDLTGTRNDRDEQARQKKVIANCLDKLTTALAAAANNNKAAYDKAVQGMDKVCNEAERYL
ncbi:hypothetical protein GA0070606_1609 [Micromonospora citrea]|uniref:Uncharacterized protein n=1 Tax=Micromonospora citrea TaxID=47855 RepID=A0A1C6U899_9ACTN|nr:hypothetical protein [Micromonospora citrea]SCL50276.1 hypothetical protein GA0070606_1609 [Micromonospora citrea]